MLILIWFQLKVKEGGDVMKITSLLLHYDLDVNIVIKNATTELYKGQLKYIPLPLLQKRVKDIEPILDENNKAVLLINIFGGKENERIY